MKEVFCQTATLNSLFLTLFEGEALADEKFLLFRCSVNRVGKDQKMASDECARIFGGFINDVAGWDFNLTDYNCEIKGYMMGNTFQVNMALTNESLHRRNIVHHGLTTLRPTICHGMLRECNIETGDIVLDPMVGCGSIPIEGIIKQIFYLTLQPKI